MTVGYAGAAMPAMRDRTYLRTHLCRCGEWLNLRADADHDRTRDFLARHYAGPAHRRWERTLA